MSTEILILKGTISDLPEDVQKRIKYCSEKILATVRGEELLVPGAGHLAMALAGMTLQEELPE